MTKNFVAYRLVIDYSLIIGNNQWLINWLPIDYLLITNFIIDFIDVIDVIDYLCLECTSQLKNFNPPGLVSGTQEKFG